MSRLGLKADTSMFNVTINTHCMYFILFCIVEAAGRSSRSNRARTQNKYFEDDTSEDDSSSEENQEIPLPLALQEKLAKQNNFSEGRLHVKARIITMK